MTERIKKKLFIKKHNLTRYIQGKGIEIGALNNPLEVAFRQAQVIYVDMLGKEDLIAQNPEVPREKINAPDIINDAEDLKDFGEESVDFVIASHILEHLPNPLKALREFWRILKKGGVLYLVVPDKRYCFDKERPATTVEHLLDDYKQDMTVTRSISHYSEWLSLVELKKSRPVADTLDNLMKKDYRIHFHTWLPETVTAVLNYLKNNFGSCFYLENYYYRQGDVELAFVLRKSSLPCDDMPELLRERYFLLRLILLKGETFVRGFCDYLRKRFYGR